MSGCKTTIYSSAALLRSRIRFDILRRCWSSSLDPMIPPDSKVWFNSRAVIDACRPYEWMKDFPEVAETSRELRRAVLEKFGRKFFGLR